MTTLWAKFLASSVGGMLKMIPTWLWFLLLGVGIAFGTAVWHRSVASEAVERAVKKEHDAMVLKINEAEAKAKTEQAKLNEAAVTNLVVLNKEQEATAVARTEKVKIYVTKNTSTATKECAANDPLGLDFKQLYNNEP